MPFGMRKAVKKSRIDSLHPQLALRAIRYANVRSGIEAFAVSLRWNDEPLKREFGPWMLRALRLLAKFKGLRGGAFDLFGEIRKRRMERQLIADYFATVDELLSKLDCDILTQVKNRES